MTITYHGHPVRILSQDTNPSTNVWLVYIDFPDTSIWVPADQLIITK